MPDQKEQLADFLEFIKERRSDESHFGELYTKLEDVIGTLRNNGNGNTELILQLEAAKEKQAVVYRQAKEKSGTAWPEFEKFVAQLERATTTMVNR